MTILVIILLTVITALSFLLKLAWERDELLQNRILQHELGNRSARNSFEQTCDLLTETKRRCEYLVISEQELQEENAELRQRVIDECKRNDELEVVIDELRKENEGLSLYQAGSMFSKN